MIGLDTNILVRYIAQDDAAQADRATALIDSLDEDNTGFVSIVVLVELHWVLRRAYKVSREEVVAVLRHVLGARELTVQHRDVVHRALIELDGAADFPDALISELGATFGCTHTVTFDRGAAKLPGMCEITEQ